MVADLRLRIVRHLEKRTRGEVGGRAVPVLEAFATDKHDKNGETGHVKAATFEKVLEDDLGVSLRSSEKALLVQRLDPFKVGAVDYQYFNRWLETDERRSISAIERRVTRAFQVLYQAAGLMLVWPRLLKIFGETIKAFRDLCVYAVGKTYWRLFSSPAVIIASRTEKDAERKQRKANAMASQLRHGKALLEQLKQKKKMLNEQHKAAEDRAVRALSVPQHKLSRT